MALLQILSVFLIALSSGLLVQSRSYNTGLYFYDLGTKQAFLPPTVSVSRGRGLANIKFSDKGSIWSTFGKPCDCRGPLCGCCVGIKVKQYDFDQKMCANVSYFKPKEEINLEVYLNETQSAKYGVSARNPSPFCIPVMMGIPMSMCVQMSNVGLQGDNLNMCMDFIVRMASTQLFEMHFQCMKMGAQGLQWVDAGGASVIPPSESKIKEGSDNNESLEYYDEEEGDEMNEIDTGNKEEEEGDEKNEVDTGNEEEMEKEEQVENNAIITVHKDGEDEDEKIKIDKENEEGQQDVEEYENKAEEVMDDRDQDLALEMQASEGEQTQENEVELSEDDENEIAEKEVSKDKIKVSEILENSTDSLEVSGFDMLTNVGETPKYPNELSENLTDSLEVSGFDMLTNVHETPGNAVTNESDSSEFLIAPMEVITEKQLNENAILANLKPTMATTTASMLAIENNDIDNSDNAATIATTIMSTITSQMASATATADAATAAAAAAALVAQGISATPKTPEATTTTVAATSSIAVDKNDSDNSQDDDSDYEDEGEDEESDENEQDESDESDEKENHNKNKMNTSGNQKEQLENVNNTNTTAAATGANLNAENEDKKIKEEGPEADKEDEDEVDEDDEDEDDEDEDDSEEDSDEIAAESLSIYKTRHQNTSLIGNITTAVPVPISLTTSSTTNVSVDDAEKITKPDEHLMYINSNHLQLATETRVNTSDSSDNTNIDISDSNNVKPTSNIIISSTSNISSTATHDSMPANAGGNNDDIVKMSQITGTVTPLTSARKLLALQRQSHPRQQQQQRQQHQQQQRQRHQKQQQQHTKWQYAHHQQVQPQHHNRIPYQLRTPRQQRNHPLYYGA